MALIILGCTDPLKEKRRYTQPHSLDVLHIFGHSGSRTFIPFFLPYHFSFDLATNSLLNLDLNAALNASNESMTLMTNLRS